MAANKTPIFVGTAKSPFVVIASGAGAVNTGLDGSGTLATNIFSLFTADATNGSLIKQIVAYQLGTNVAGMIRIFLNNGSTNGTVANNILIGELAMPAYTLSQTVIQTTSQFQIFDFGADGLQMAAAYRILVCSTVNVAAGYGVYIRGCGDLT